MRVHLFVDHGSLFLPEVYITFICNMTYNVLHYFTLVAKVVDNEYRQAIIPVAVEG